MNAGLIAGLSSTTYYWSTLAPSVSDYRTEMEELPYLTHLFYDHNGRSVLNALSCARYYVRPSGYDGPVPYGYQRLGDYYNGRYTVFESKNALPLGYTYERSVGRQVWEQLSALEKQEAMLSAVYLDREEGNTSPEALALRSRDLPCTVEPEGDGVSVAGNRFVVTAPGATVHLRFEGLPDCETYLVVKDVQFSCAPDYDLYLGDETRDPQDAYSREAWEQMDPETRTELRREKFFWRQSEQINLGVQLSSGSKESIPLIERNLSDYNGRDDFTVQLGYCREPEGQITLTFPENGIYTFGSLEVWGQSMEGFSQAIDRLREDSLQDVVIGDDTISGSISLDRPKILCLSIPYSEGWSALVDGEEAPLLRANVGYTALELDAGEHEILLRYHTPLMKAGAVISVLSFPALAAVVFFTERKKKRAALDGRRESAPAKSARFK